VSRWLEVDLTYPSPTTYTASNPLIVFQDYTFNVNATVKCQTIPTGYSCGDVSGSVRYNETGNIPNELIKVVAENAVYNPTLGAPECTSGFSPCIAPSSLLECIDSSSPPEPNQPNTIDACTDGSSGTCHGDESIENITITEVGGDGVFEPGDTINVTYWTYCWSTGASNWVAVYYTNDTTSPSWVRKTPTGIKCPAGGYQKFSVTFTLDNVVGRHAVRAIMKYNSEVSTPCDSGSYIDKDDVAFQVSSPVSRWLEVDLTYPSPTTYTASNPLIVPRYEIFNVNATVKCKTNPSGYSCGDVYGSVRYNSSGTTPNQLISMIDWWSNTILY
jgi:hypothetical protein